jgi:hypothetical protein
MPYRVRRIALWPLVRYTAALGALMALPAGATAGLLLGWALRAARAKLESWQSVRLPLPVASAVSPAINFVELLQLGPLLALLRAWDQPATLIATTAAFVLLGLLFGAAAGLIAGALFNAGAGLGALVVDVDRVDEPRHGSEPE